MINFDAYFENVLTAILILTNVVLILHVNHLCYFNSISFLLISAQRWFDMELELLMIMACLFLFTNVKFSIHVIY